MVFRDYVVLRPVAVGGFGEVWLVHHSILRTKFALKVIANEQMASDPDAKARFLCEVRFAAKIRHPAILAVYDAGFDKDTGLFFCLMDFMPGGTLENRLAKSRRLSVTESVRIARAIAEGLAEMRCNGIVHRDVKPANIMFAVDGSARLSDFGIAMELHAVDTAQKLPDFTLGTPVYMPKEQIENANGVDCRADVYSLGVTLFEMLTGKCPDVELSVDELFERRLAGKRIPNVCDVNKAVPRALADLVERMTDPDCDRRIENPQMVADSLARFDGTAKSVGDNGNTQVSGRVASHVLAALGGAAFFGFVVAAAWWDGLIGFMPERAAEDDEVVDEWRPEEDEEEPAPVVEQRTERVVYITNVVERVVEVASSKDDVKPPQNDPAAQEVSPETAPQSGESAAEAVAAAGGDSDAPAPEAKPEPVQMPTETVCGIAVTYPSDLGDRFARLKKMIVDAEGATRTFKGLPENAPVQNVVKRIDLVSYAGVRHNWNKRERSLTIGPESLDSPSKLSWLVAGFMTSGMDVIREPFADDIALYIRYRVRDVIQRFPQDGASRINSAIAAAMKLEEEYGVCDYEGVVVRFRTRQLRLPFGKVKAHCTGAVFDLLQRVDADRSGRTLGRYFAAKRRFAPKLGAKDGRKAEMTASDFVALLSIAYGRDLFRQMIALEWSVSKKDTAVKIGNLEPVFFFGR